MDVQMLYLMKPPPSLRLSEEERQHAITVTIPLHKRSEGHSIATVRTAVRTAQERLQLQTVGRTLQLSLHGIVLDPQEDIAELLADLPSGTRSRVVFLLSPQIFEGVERPSQDPLNEMTREPPVKQAATFAGTPPPSIETAGLSVDPQEVHHPRLEAISPNVRRRQRVHDTTPRLCVFRESWLHPSRCVRCGSVRSQHRVFTPARQKQLQDGMTPPRERLWRRPLVPQEEQEEGQPPSFSLPHYYANPGQWEPKRGQHYHSASQACDHFFGSWGNPNLCCRCHRKKDAHSTAAIPTTPRAASLSVRRSHNSTSPQGKNGTSSSRRPRVACEHFMPLWNNNDYCLTCYSQRSSHSLKAQHHSSVIQITPQGSLPTPMRRRKKTQVTHRTLTSSAGEKETVTSKIGLGPTAGSSSVRRSKPKSVGISCRVVADAGTKAVDHSLLSSPSSSPSALFAVGRSVLSTPQRVLSLSRPLSNAGGTSVVDTTATTTTRINGNYSFSSRDIPWAIVLQYVTLEGLLVCREVCATVCAVATPLILANLRYIIDILDVPQQKRDMLAECADLYASLFVRVLHQKSLSLEPFDASTRLLPFYYYCVLELFHTTQVLHSIVGDAHTLAKDELKMCGLRDSFRYRRSSLPSRIAATIARRGILIDDELNEDELAYYYSDCYNYNYNNNNKKNNNGIDVVASLIQNVAYCDTALLPETASQCIGNAFEEITLLVASSLLRLCTDGKMDDFDSHVRNTRFMSLGDFFEENALVPMVDFLQAVDVVVRLKWKARKWLDRLHIT